MLPTVLRLRPGVGLIVCGLVVFTTSACFKLSSIVFFLLMFSILFSVVITSLGEGRAGLYVSQTFDCLSCMRHFLSCFSYFGVGGWLRLVIVALTA